MKRTPVYALLLLTAAAIVSCQKDRFQVLGDHYEKTGNSVNLFHITCASLSDGTVTLEVHHGGDAPQAFTATWDGKVTNPIPDSCAGCRQVEVILTMEGTTGDSDTLSYNQSVPVGLEELKISLADLNSGTLLKFVNASDETNAVYLYVTDGAGKGGECTWTINGGTGDGTVITTDPDLIYNLPVMVAESSCEKGVWGGLWLRTDLSVQDSLKPDFIWLMPADIVLVDSLGGYQPKAGDRLTGTFRKVKSDDVCADRISDTQPVNIITLYKR